MKAVFLPNSQFTQLPWDYLHPNHAGYNAMGLVVDIAPFAPRHRHSGSKPKRGRAGEGAAPEDWWSCSVRLPKRRAEIRRWCYALAGLSGRIGGYVAGRP